jgi:hypothetical protein
LTALMVYEKTGRHGAAIVRPVGAVLIGAAVLQLVHPSWLPTALGGSKSFASDIHLGPGPVKRVIQVGGYELDLQLSPNRATRADTLSVRLRKAGKPVRGAGVRATFTMLDMNMPGLSTGLPQTGPGAYGRRGLVLGMSGDWGLSLEITPRDGAPLVVRAVDRLGP